MGILEEVRFKDSTPDPTHDWGYRYVHFGDGDAPRENFLKLLKGMGYEGFLSFEHEKRWHPEIPDPEEALPVFVERMRHLREVRL